MYVNCTYKPETTTFKRFNILQTYLFMNFIKRFDNIYD